MCGPEPASVWAAVASAAATGGLVTAATLGVFHPRVALFGPVVWRGPTTRPAVALTFDDGPDPRHTSHIADILEAHQARATFFCIGRQLELYNSLGRFLHYSGHQLENHTYSHGTGLDLFWTSRLRKDIQRCQDVLAHLTGRAPSYYRPAVGIRNPPVHAAARGLGLTVVTWTYAARDGVFPFTAERALALAGRAQPGSILALHDGQLRGDSTLREQTVRHLPLLLKRLQERGLAFETLASLLES
jgi:peptidoglycan/xylan/chitin deacetylase (PgdA/CDA1 family)